MSEHSWDFSELQQAPVTRSRVQKGFLAIPAELTPLFPSERARVCVRCDDDAAPWDCLYVPAGTSAKEARLFGLTDWFGRAQVRAGQRVGIRFDPAAEAYHLFSDSFLRRARATEFRRTLRQASSPLDVQRQLQAIATVRRRPLRQAARDELRRIAAETWQPTRSARRRSGLQRLPASPWLRALLGEVYRGRCQLCGFGFTRADGHFHFEVHHLDPKAGDNPRNLLLVCPNCHARLTHCEVSEPELEDGWLVRLRLNGQRQQVRQALLTDVAVRPPLLVVAAAFAVLRILADLSRLR